MTNVRKLGFGFRGAFSRRVLTLIVACLMATVLRATEKWTALPQNARAIIAFKGHVFSSLDVGNVTGNVDLLKTRDGSAWEAVSGPRGLGSIQTFVIHRSNSKDILFGFAYDSLRKGQLFRTEDGIVWEELNTFADKPCSGAISYKNYLWVTDEDGSVHRTLGVGNPVQWDSYLNSEPLGKTVVKFAIFKDRLYQAIQFNTGLRVVYTELSWIDDPVTWTQHDMYSHASPSNVPNVELTVHRDASGQEALYCGLDVLLKTAGGSWEVVQQGLINAGRNKIAPFVLRGGTSLHVFAHNSPIQVLSDQGVWEAVEPLSPALCEYDKINRVAEVNGVAFINACQFLMMRFGVRGLQPVTFPDTSLSYNMKDVPVFGFMPEVNLDDKIRQVTLRNEGTARAGLDLTEVKLHQQRQDGQIQFLTTLVPVGPDGKTWATPPSFELSLKGDTRLIATVSIAKNPTPGSTVRLALPAQSLSFSVNETFQNPLMTASHSRSISGAPSQAPDAIEGVMVAPQPAENVVHFRFDLAANADVLIKIFDRNGVLVSEINESKSSGPGADVVWNAENKAPGTYFVTIKIKTAGEAERFYKKAIFIKR